MPAEPSKRGQIRIGENIYQFTDAEIKQEPSEPMSDAPAAETRLTLNHDTGHYSYEIDRGDGIKEIGFSCEAILKKGAY